MSYLWKQFRDAKSTEWVSPRLSKSHDGQWRSLDSRKFSIRMKITICPLKRRATDSWDSRVTVNKKVSWQRAVCNKTCVLCPSHFWRWKIGLEWYRNNLFGIIDHGEPSHPLLSLFSNESLTYFYLKQTRNPIFISEKRPL